MFTISGLSTIYANIGLLTAKNILNAIPPKIAGKSGLIIINKVVEIIVKQTQARKHIILYPLLSTNYPMRGTKIIAKINSIVIYFPAITYLSLISISESEA